MATSLGDAPIEEKHRDLMQALAVALDEALNPGLTGNAKKIGFVLLVFPYDGHEGRANYISNGADRKDICTLFREQIARFEGQPEVSGRA
ncbi:hypothetical protein ASD45_08380 [Pseudolabrys sp. Root1462]|uniref:hypothetical protein n=1 Tax=Pseudolabrys sp. Root1462 TaxID=1736466 RepID=UPI00070247BF|nr:hypothetical protein [Pseudolabrys sp. Root1462]KQZ00869.1 hypothetical protein ASD45_08380 [Pseudolabrys sp. Root1462]